MPKKKRLLIIIAISVGVFILLIGGLYLLGLASQQQEDSPYDFQRAQQVQPNHTFSYTVGFDPNSLESFKKSTNDFSDAIGIYSDQNLSQEVLASYSYSPGSGKLDISPTAQGATAFKFGTDEKQTLWQGQAWGLYSQYYLAQKRDLSTGKPLQKPKVTPFSVKKELSAPIAFSSSINTNGEAQLAWQAVPNAQKYLIVKIVIEKPAGTTPRQSTTILGETAKTEWSSAQLDTQLDIGVQNKAFTGYKESQDQQRQYNAAGRLAGRDRTYQTTYGVIAVSGQQLSGLNAVDGQLFEGKLPQQKAAYASEAELKIPSDISVVSFNRIPTQVPITMADGSTALRSVELHSQAVSKSEILSDISGSLRPTPTLKVPYTVTGTKIKGEYQIIEFNEATYSAEIARISERNKLAQIRTGGPTPYNYQTAVETLDNVQISKGEPQTNRNITATNPASRYLAAHMLAGNKFVDVKQFQNKQIDIYDAAYEAINQNPFIFNVKDISLHNTEGVLEIQYYAWPDDVARAQKETADQIDRIARDITNGKNDLEKVTAINNYLTQNVAYDYTALSALNALPLGYTRPEGFEYAWTPYGALVDQKKLVVCGGYAAAFKALADSAGLESIIVTGQANGQNHAWNKVKINGSWRALDVTFNDVETEPNKYLNLTDAQMSTTHRQDSYFIVDQYISSYNTN